jgi:thiol-disulfide isomerase/thioredoxin
MRSPRSIRATRNTFGVALALAVVASCGGNASSQTGWPDVDIVAAGDGVAVSSAQLVAEGTSVISLWATWCAPCKRELPMLQDMADDGTTVIGVNIGDSPDAVDAFLRDLGVDFPNYIDVDGEVMSALDVPSVPATLIVVDGDLVWQHLGEVSRADIDAQLTAID